MKRGERCYASRVTPARDLRMLAVHRSTIGAFAREWRPASFAGPQQVSHESSLELCAIDEGEECSLIDGVHTRMARGQYGLILPGVEHSSWQERQTSTQTIVHIRTSELDRAREALGLPASSMRFAHEARSTPTELEAILAALRVHTRAMGHSGGTAPSPSHHAGAPAIARAEPARDLLVDSLFTHLALWIVDRHGRRPSDRPPAIDDEPRHVTRLRELESELRAHPERERSLDDLAAAVGVSRFTLLRLFKRVYRTTPHAHLVKLRVERATHLLRDTELNVTAVAIESGFGSASKLIEAFRRAHGETPDRWRRRVTAIPAE